MNFDKLKQRYLNDPEFNFLVDALILMIEKCQFAPSEIKEAAMFACINFEMEYGRKTMQRVPGFDDEAAK